jgi:hypothetical protein
MKKKKKMVKRGKGWFRFMKVLMSPRYPRPEFRFLGKEIENGAILLSNHEGTDAPMSLEMYLDRPLRMWGTGEMNSGVVRLYKYQTKVYYHEKKHWNIHLARLFCLLASPLTNLFYKGLNLISTWHDARFVGTLRESVRAIQEGNNIVIYPEDSTRGYLTELDGFHAGFVALCDTLLRRGIDVEIYVSYFKKKERIYIIDAPVHYSEIKAMGMSREEVAKHFVERCNALGRGEYEWPPRSADADAEQAHASEPREAAIV